MTTSNISELGRTQTVIAILFYLYFFLLTLEFKINVLSSL